MDAPTHLISNDGSRLERCTIASTGIYSERFSEETLVFVETGEFTIQSVSRQVSASTGGLLFLRPGEMLIHCHVDTAPAQALLVNLGSGLLHHFINRYGEVVAQIPRLQNALPDALEITITPLIEQAGQHLLSLVGLNHPQEILELRIEELLLLLVLSDSTHQLAAIIRQKSHRTADRLRMFMDRNFKNDWKLEKFAREFGASLTTFKETFTEIFGISPRAWICERRLLYAHQLLLSSELSIVDVAAEAGFSSQSYFTQSYKRRFGETPSHTRKASLKK